MRAHTRAMITGAVRAFLYGCGLALLAFAIIFCIGYLAGDSVSWARGYEWAVRCTYIIGAVGVLIGSVCMLSTGGKTREEQLDPNNYMVPAPLKRVPGISWPVAIIWGSFAFIVIAGLIETTFYAFF